MKRLATLGGQVSVRLAYFMLFCAFLLLPNTVVAADGLLPVNRGAGAPECVFIDGFEASVPCIPSVLNAVALNGNTVEVNFNRPLDAASVVPDASQFVFDNGLVASAADASGQMVTVTSSAQTVMTTYTVTVANTVLDNLGAGIDPGSNDATFTGLQGCDRMSFSAVTMSATGFGPDTVVYTAGSSLSDPLDQLALEFGPGAVFTGHEFTFTGENYSTCVECLLTFSDCTLGMCEKTFLAQSGLMSVTSSGNVGDILAGSLSDIVAREVTIDPGTLVSTLVPDGEVWCLADYAFSSLISAP